MVEVSIIVVSGTDRKGNAVFSAEGTIDEREFVAQTIQYKGEPIFKVLENNSHYSLNNSSFSRGDRSRIARACKLARIEKFGEPTSATLSENITVVNPACAGLPAGRPV